ncbi:MAG: hypothetical protein GTN76_08560, partial [Candidatus Aenigmarchaeota archaeon]|nr:hypothetical protein [Candidatus Aenigmarchaeota archaeon]
ALARGFLLLSPIPGLFVHFFMVFTYPIIVGWAVARTADSTEKGPDIPDTQKVMLEKLALVLGFVAVWLVICYVLVTLWEATGFWIWLVLFFISTLILVRRIK